MGKLMTEMLKGTLEGIVLATLCVRPAYGYEITAWLPRALSGSAGDRRVGAGCISLI